MQKFDNLTEEQKAKLLEALKDIFGIDDTIWDITVHGTPSDGETGEDDYNYTIVFAEQNEE